jgi:hypothetical protein
MVAAGLIVEFVFDGLNLIPNKRKAKVIEASVTLNYTNILNIVFLALGALLVWRYFRRGGGLRMLKMMNAPIPPRAGARTWPRLIDPRPRRIASSSFMRRRPTSTTAR